MSKKEKQPTRKIYKDFTLDEYDVFIMDKQCEGALSERNAIITELQLHAARLYQYSDTAGVVPDRDQFAQRAAGLKMAAKIIAKMPHYEDRCGCRECGAI